MKKVWKGAAAAIAALSLGVTGFVGATSAYAETVTTGSITITDDATTARDYNAYQIFAGKYDTESGVLSDVTWGTGITPAGHAALISEVTSQVTAYNKTAADGAKITALPENPTAADVAKTITALNLGYNTPGAKALANVFKTSGTLSDTKTPLTKENNTYKAQNIATGYYLIEDSTTMPNTSVNEAKTSFLLQVVGDATATPKRSVPTVSKEVEDEKDNAAGDKEFGPSADHDLFETFQFKLVANIPANADRADYDSYMIRFKDTMSNGITFEQVNSVVVSGATAGTPATTAQITVPASGYTLKGNDGTPLTGTQDGGEFSIEIADLKALKTTDDKALDITKGITATVLYNAHLNANAVITDQTHNPDTNGTSSNPNTVYLEYSNNPNGEGVGKTGPQKVYVYSFEMDGLKVDMDDNTTKLAGAEFELYKDQAMTQQIKIAEVSTPDSGNVYRVAAANATNAKIVTPANGKFTIKGLDNGTYYLKETKAPNGYNLPADPFEFTVTATHTVTEGVPSVTLTGGKVELTIPNSKGSELPETGGMGTTVLYVAGAAIVLIAGIGLAVTLRRRQA